MPLRIGWRLVRSLDCRPRFRRPCWAAREGRTAPAIRVPESPGRQRPEQEVPQVAVLGRQQLARATVKSDPSLVQDHEFRLRGLVVFGTDDRDPSIPLHGFVRGDVERVPDLVGHDDAR